MSDYDEVVLRESTDSIEEVYTCAQFINQIKNLSEISILYTCKFSDFELAQIYETTIDKFSVKAMSLGLVREFVNNLRQKNKEELSAEVEYYRGQIAIRLKSSIETMSKKQFWKVIGNRSNKDRDGILTQIFMENSRSASYISCKKIMTILEEVVTQIETNYSPALSFDTLLTKRISDKEVEVYGNVDDILDAFRHEQNTQLEKYFSLWHHKMQYVYEFITDEEVRFQVQTFLQNINALENNLLEEINQVYAKSQELRNTCMEFDEVNQRLTKQIELYEQALDERKNQVSEMVQQMRELQKQHKLLQKENSHLNAVMGEGKVNLVSLSKEYNELEEQLAQYKQKYNEIYSEYQQLVQQRNTQVKIAKKEEQAKIFAERTTKQQLDDTLHKFNKLLKERNAERKAFEEKEESRMNQIEMLENKVVQLENEIKDKTQQLNLYITKSKISEFRSSVWKNSRISIKSGIMGELGSGIFDIRPSKIIRSSIKRQKSKPEVVDAPESQKQIRNSLRQTLNLEGEPASNLVTLSKIKTINIAAESLSQIREEDDVSFLIDATLLPPQQNLTNIINTDSAQKKADQKQSNSPEKQQIQKLVKADSTLQNKINDQYFMSKGVLINIYGVKTQTTFLMTKKRFCFFDTKLRLSKYLPIENIKSFVFCRINTTMFIIRPKNLMELNSREHIVNPLIISTRNRAAFASFLVNKIGKFIRQNQIELMTRYEDDIFLKIEGNQINMKHKVPNMKNPYRLATSHIPVFYAKLQEEGFFNLKHNAMLIIQPLGIICFEGNEIYDIEGQRQFLQLLPLDESKIYEKEDSKEAPGRKVRITYQTQSLESYFSLTFNSKEDVKLFLKAVEEQRKTIDQSRITTYKALDQMFKK